MITSSPFLNLVIIIIITYIILIINLKIFKKIFIPFLFLLILLYYLGPLKLKQQLDNFSLKILGIKKEIHIRNSKNIENKMLNYKEEIKNKINNLIKKIKDESYNNNNEIDNSHK